MNSRRGKYYPWLVLSVFSLMFFLVTAATFTSLGVVLPSMVKDLGWDWTSAGLGFTLLGISCGLSSYPPAMTIRRYGVRVTVLIGTVLLVAGFLSLFATHSVWLYFVGTTLAGTGFSFVSTVPGTYVIARAFEKQSIAFGIYFTIGGLGGIIGPFIYFSAMAIWGDWRMHWMIVAVATAIAGLAIILVLREDEEERRAAAEVEAAAAARAAPGVYMTKQAWTAPLALRTPQFYIISAAYISFLLCGITVNSLSVAHLSERGISMAMAGSLLSIEAFLNSLSRVLSGFIGEYVEPKFLLLGSLLFLIMGMVALSFATTFPFLIIYAIGIGVGYGATFLATSVLLTNYYGRKPYLELFSIMNLAATLASCGPWLGGHLRDTTGSFVPAFLAFSIVPAVVFLAVTVMRPPRFVEAKAADAEEAAPVEPRARFVL
ncbi:CynX/NimT family MFS transporter [Parvibaculum sp.]|uniref:MFS transporter n=1 Tax=Parvibaculum sp. TaxID=2024848 RepID=UPI002C390876|nr:MFS transporter [Parvibaculum sp.]HUD49885.1 MFS transporter [Parvibaculum sp.]